MIFGTSATWAYINNQMDFSRRFAVHVATPDMEPLCGHGKTLDEVMDETQEWFMDYPWACKICKRMIAPPPVHDPQAPQSPLNGVLRGDCAIGQHYSWNDPPCSVCASA